MYKKTFAKKFKKKCYKLWKKLEKRQKIPTTALTAPQNMQQNVENVETNNMIPLPCANNTHTHWNKTKNLLNCYKITNGAKKYFFFF